MPSFKGGHRALYQYITEHLVYPDQAIKEGIEGKVFVGFTILADGSIGDAAILKGIGGDCDEEALRLVESMPVWDPGRQRGKSIDIKFRLPINFTLPSKSESKKR